MIYRKRSQQLGHGFSCLIIVSVTFTKVRNDTNIKMAAKMAAKFYKEYRRNPENRNTLNNCCNCAKIGKMWFYYLKMCPKYVKE